MGVLAESIMKIPSLKILSYCEQVGKNTTTNFTKTVLSKKAYVLESVMI